jgi:hypothetical protein
MRAAYVRGAAVATVLALLMTACGPEETDAADPAGGSSAAQSPSSGASADSQEEQITPGGIAAVVLEHLGRDAVRQFVTFVPAEEPGTVGVMVRLRDRTPHNFSVQVHSPEQAEKFPAHGGCGPERQGMGEQRCRTLEDGTTVVMREMSEGFSDSNVDGSVLSGAVVTPEDGAVLSMYESYDDSPAISGADLEALLTDPRLTWLTDPAVNEAGDAVDVKEITG